VVAAVRKLTTNGENEEIGHGNFCESHLANNLRRSALAAGAAWREIRSQRRSVKAQESMRCCIGPGNRREGYQNKWYFSMYRLTFQLALKA